MAFPGFAKRCLRIFWQSLKGLKLFLRPFGDNILISLFLPDFLSRGFSEDFVFWTF